MCDSATPTPKAAAGAAAERRRILFVEGNVDGTIGGSYYSLLFLATGLDQRRYEPVVAFHSDNALISRFRAAGIDTRIFPARRPIVFRSPITRVFAKTANFLKGFVFEPLRLAGMLRAQRFHLVHLNNSVVTNHVWMLAAMIAGIPCVTHERGINPTFSTRSRWLARRLDSVICISGAVRDNFVRAGLGSIRMCMIPNGLDPAEMKVTRSALEIRREFGLPPDSRLVGIVGNIRRWKGQEVFVRALARIAGKYPGLAALVIGDTDPANRHYRQHIDRLLEEGGLTCRVAITGYRNDVADYVNALEILVHASIKPEPFGRVVLEGMALRKPIIASRDGGVQEIVVDGCTGLLFTPGDDSELASRLIELIDDPVRAATMGQAGYQRLLEEFSMRKNVAATESIYDSLLAG